MKLIPEWKKAWKFLSVQLAALVVIWASLPADMHQSIIGVLHLSAEQTTALLGVLVIVGRLVAQPAVRGEK